MKWLKTGIAGDYLNPANHLLVYLGPLLLFRVPFSPMLSTGTREQALTHHFLCIAASGHRCCQLLDIF